MKFYSQIKRCALLLMLIGGSWSLCAQENTEKTTNKEVRVKKHTVLAQFEPELVVPVEERMHLKNERLNTIKERRAIIDTLTLSDRKRRKLLKELYRSPFSYHWDKIIADIEEEDELEEEDPKR